MSELVARLYDNWRAWGSPVDRDTCINETCMAMDCKEAADTFERYRQALIRANGFLIMHGLEPVTLEYPAFPERSNEPIERESEMAEHAPKASDFLP